MIFNMVGGGGGSGATLVVSSPANVSVTVSKDDKSYTKNSGSLGSTTFKGLATGTWTVVISNGGQTSTRTIEITADYAITITFFSATINITYPAGATCTATDGVITLTAPDTSGTWACIVPNAGTWTVSLNNGFSKTVTISENGETKTIDKWYLYNSGDECTYITGGFKKYIYDSGYGSSTASVTKNTNNVVFNVNRGSATGSHQSYVYLYTENPVNLKYFKEIRVTISQRSAGRSSILVLSNPPSSPNPTVIAAAYPDGSGIKSLMIENIESGYVAVGLDTNGLSEGGSASMTITKIACVG